MSWFMKKKRVIPTAVQVAEDKFNFRARSCFYSENHYGAKYDQSITVNFVSCFMLWFCENSLRFSTINDGSFVVDGNKFNFSSQKIHARAGTNVIDIYYQNFLHPKPATIKKYEQYACIFNAFVALLGLIFVIDLLILFSTFIAILLAIIMNLEFHTLSLRISRQNTAISVPERFILAENGDYSSALTRWNDTQKWRQDNNIDDVLRQQQHSFTQIKKHYPHFFHETDLNGNIVYYECPGQLNWQKIKETGIDGDFINHVTFIQEYLWGILRQRQEDRVTLVLDLGGLTMPMLFNNEIVSLLKQCVVLTSTHYPQRSHRMVIINVPFWFGKLFAIVKPLLNDAQKAKIRVYRPTEVLAGLKNVIPIENIPAKYGGTSMYAAGQSPEEMGLAEYVKKLK